MIIGIKYCGGCNSRYDRTEVLEKLKSDFLEYTFEYLDYNKVYDIIIIIAGCTSNCVDDTQFNSKYGVQSIDSLGEYKDLVKKLML